MCIVTSSHIHARVENIMIGAPHRAALLLGLSHNNGGAITYLAKQVRSISCALCSNGKLMYSVTNWL